jgi:hypothetical protein
MIHFCQGLADGNSRSNLLLPYIRNLGLSRFHSSGFPPFISALIPSLGLGPLTARQGDLPLLRSS